MDQCIRRQIASSSESNANLDTNENSEQDSEWQTICQIAIASESATAAVWLQLTAFGIAMHSSQLNSNPASRASTRRSVIIKLIGRERQCTDLLRLNPSVFEFVVSELKNKTNVKEYRNTTIEEHLITFLLLLGHNVKNLVVSFILSRSGETISRYFHNILLAIITLEQFYVKLANGEEVQPNILNSQRFCPYFKDCLGAIDGTHVRVKVSQVDEPRYIWRKEWPTQNVLAACTFDLKFTYILAGWEGSASDSRILQSALTRAEPLVILEGKFFLGDSGFGSTNKLLTPYGRTRYHLKEYSQRGPETLEELFNHRHSSLMNAIERAFGVLKKRFPIIASGTKCRYTCATMTNIILACTVLHNFLITVDYADQEYLNFEEVQVTDCESVNPHTDMLSENTQDISTEHLLGQELRDRIAAEMWAEYRERHEGA